MVMHREVVITQKRYLQRITINSHHFQNRGLSSKKFSSVSTSNVTILTHMGNNLSYPSKIFARWLCAGQQKG